MYGFPSKNFEDKNQPNNFFLFICILSIKSEYDIGTLGAAQKNSKFVVMFCSISTQAWSFRVSNRRAPLSLAVTFFSLESFVKQHGHEMRPKQTQDRALFPIALQEFRPFSQSFSPWEGKTQGLSDTQKYMYAFFST